MANAVGIDSIHVHFNIAGADMPGAYRSKHTHMPQTGRCRHENCGVNSRLHDVSAEALCA